VPAIDKRKAVQAALNFTHQRRFDKAIAEYKNALLADPNDLNVHMKLGDLYAQTGATQEAIGTYMKLGDLYRTDGLAVKAIAIYKKVLSLDPRNMQIYLACADLYAEQGLVGEAKIQYMAVAEHYTKAGDAAKALTIFEKIAGLDPTNFAVAAKVGEMCERERLPDQAVGHYVAAAQAAVRAGATREATEFFNRALKVKPTAFEAFFGLGKLHAEAGSMQEAAAALERAAASAPDNAAPLLLLGQCYQRLNAADKAEDALRRATAADPMDSDAHLALGRLLLEAGRAGEASEVFVTVADLYLDEARAEDALALLRDLSAEQPRAVAVLAKLAQVQHRLGQEEEARETEARRAEVLELEGRTEEAKAIYQGLLEANPEDAVSRERLGALESMEQATDLNAGEAAVEAVSLEVFEDLPAEEPVPRVIPIAGLAEAAPAEDLAALAEAEAALGLLGAEVAEPTPAAEAADDSAEVAEQLAEADVYLKYGLVEKAVERLRETLAELPHNLAARSRLRKILAEEGRLSEASAEGLALAEALVRGNQVARGIQELEAALVADPDHEEIRARLNQLREGAIPAAPAPAPEPAESPPPPAESLAELASAGGPLEAPPASLPLDIAEPAALETPADEPPAHWRVLAAPPTFEHIQPVAEDIGASAGEIDLSTFLHVTESLEAAAAPPGDSAGVEMLGTSPPVPEGGEEGLPRLDLDRVADEDVVTLEIPAEEPPVDAVQEFSLNLGGADEELDEVRFFQSQGMVAEAAVVLRRILGADPGNLEAQAALAALTEPAAEPSPPAEIVAPMAPVPVPPPVSDDTWIPGPDPFALEAPAELDPPLVAALGAPPPSGPGMDLLDLEETATTPASSLPAEQELVPPPVGPPPRAIQDEAPPAPRRRGIGPAEDIPVFRVARPVEEAGPGGFVNLGDELQEEMKTQPTLPVSAEGEALLNALLEEFQRGVRENLDAQDYETHYNLGIAYKEMDLCDEAIEAFRLAAQDPRRRLTCSNLIALCYLSKGEPERAVEQLLGALALPGYPPEEYYGLRYDLAAAYEAAAQDANALRVLEELLEQAPSFRQVKDRVGVLRRRVGVLAAAPISPPAAGDGKGIPQVAAGHVPPPAEPVDSPATGAPGQDVVQRAAASPPSEEAPAKSPAPKPARPRRDKVSFV
jgi:tetratricopeptide (TPR) repeat protein